MSRIKLRSSEVQMYWSLWEYDHIFSLVAVFPRTQDIVSGLLLRDFVLAKLHPPIIHLFILKREKIDKSELGIGWGYLVTNG